MLGTPTRGAKAGMLKNGGGFSRKSVWILIVGCVAACGSESNVLVDGNASERLSLAASQGQGDVHFDGTLVKKPFVPRSAFWGIESRGSAKGPHAAGYNTHDLIVLLSSLEDPCSGWPRSIASEGHMGLFLRMSKLVRHAGSAVFVEPDEGTYHVDQPHGSVPMVSRGAEILFRATTPQHGDIDAWLANDGLVELTEHSSGSDIVRGSFVNNMVPFSLDEEPSGPVRPISGEFVARRCAIMDEKY